MNVVDEVRRLRDQGVELWVADGGALAYRAPLGALSEADRELLRTHRSDVITMLTEAGSADRRSPLSVAQLRLWLVHERQGSSPAHSIGGAYRLTGQLDVARFEAALRIVTRRHPALRTAVVTSGGLPVQEVYHDVEVQLSVHDVPAPASDAVLNHLVAEYLGRPFELATAPLHRTALLRVADDDHVAVVVAHHIVSDDYSVGLFGREVLVTYDALSRGASPSAAEVAAGSSGENTADRAPQVPVADPERDPRVAARRLALADAPHAALPAPAQRPSAEPWQAWTRRTRVSGVEALQECRRATGGTTAALALAMTALAVRAAGGPDDVLAGMPDFGRDTTADWQAIGCFATTLTVRADLRGDETFGDLTRRMLRETIAAREASHTAPETLVGERGRSTAGGAVLWVATYPEPDLPEAAGLTVRPLAAGGDLARHDLRVAVRRGPTAIEVMTTHRVLTVEEGFAGRVAEVLDWLHRCPPAATAPVDRILEAARGVLDRATPEPAAAPGDGVPGEGSQENRDGAAMLAQVRAARRARRANDGAGSRDLVTVSRPSPAHWQAATVTARLPGLELWRWLDTGVGTVQALLQAHGAVLLRGFVGVSATFGDVLERVVGLPLVDYLQRSTPRSRVAGNVFTSTEYPSDQVIPMHSEQSYTTTWPLWLAFHCQQAPGTGGATPLASNADVLAGLPDHLVERFDADGVLYERWYHPGLDLPWQEVFQTDDPVEVTRQCDAAGVTSRWHGDGRLQTLQRAQATVAHPLTGQRVWFNQANLFHPAALPPAAAASLRATCGDRLPRTARYGDGEPIQDVDVHRVQEAFDRASRHVAWQEGDVVIVDNLAVAHGRQPFQGDRRVLVAMAGLGSAVPATPGSIEGGVTSAR